MSNYTAPEQWKQYKDTCYSVSDNGRLRNDKTGKILKSFFTGGQHVASVHCHSINLARAIWETFRGPIPDGYCIKYKNDCSTMCDLYNLAIVPRSESASKASRKAMRIGTRVRDKNTGKVYKSVRAASRALYVSRGCITSYFARNSKNSVVNLEIVD